jgi:alkylation response protein AidB-like acyl-CoA dehydrogenase
MDFELSDEQEAFRKVVRGFAESEIAPHVETWDRTHEFRSTPSFAMGDLGLFI